MEEQGQLLSQVQVIDLSQGEEAAAAQVRAACLSTGFFYGTGLPIPYQLPGGSCAAIRQVKVCSMPSLSGGALALGCWGTCSGQARRG